MMTFGVQLFGNNENPQIDNTGAISMTFLGKGSISLNQQLTSAGVVPNFSNAWRASSNGEIAVAGAQLYAFRSAYGDRPVGIWEERGGVNGRTVEFVGYGNNDGTVPLVYWWAFGRPPANPESWGAVAWNDDAKMSWSSAGRPMIIRAGVSEAPRQAINASVNGDYALCVGNPLGAVRSGTETPVSGQYRWLESRLMWAAPSATGFAQPSSFPVKQKDGNSYPTGRRESDMRATMLLVDVGGL